MSACIEGCCWCLIKVELAVTVIFASIFTVWFAIHYLYGITSIFQFMCAHSWNSTWQLIEIIFAFLAFITIRFGKGLACLYNRFVSFVLECVCTQSRNSRWLFIEHMLAVRIIQTLFLCQSLTLRDDAWTGRVGRFVYALIQINKWNCWCDLLIMPSNLSSSFISHWSWNICFVVQAFIIHPTFSVVPVSIFVIVVEGLAPTDHVTHSRTFCRSWIENKLLFVDIQV